MGSLPAHALMPKETAVYFNGPKITEVTDTQARLSLSSDVLKGITEEEKSGIYFEYVETHMVCIAIYPTPEHCLPKKTAPGVTSTTIANLKPGTSYTVKYKRDNTIRCITTPCPGNEFESQAVEFVTKKQKDDSSVATSSPAFSAYSFLRNLWVGSRGGDVTALQNILKEGGYFSGEATGYFGGLTMKAVRAFQKDNGISQTGYFGPLTRDSIGKRLNKNMTDGDVFEGKVTAYSTACFADGECSITVDGKKVVTTIGWSQAVVGKVVGIPDFGSIENHVGAHAKVYAKKTEDGYTLYGSDKYYVKITPKESSSSKLPAGSAPSGDTKSVKGNTWVWQKTVMSDGTVVMPNKPGVFTITFGADGNLTGKTDCNGFFGGYTFGSDGFIKFGPLASTLMFCDGSQEQVFTGAVGKVDRYSVDGSGSLQLLLSENAGTIYFTKK